ncbi:MAG: hypothetical protein HOH26_05170, partial [Alphaproteobacteria bacterium]|nr:hypothetical protein [Alphaproteobacteria bacterium]
MEFLSEWLPFLMLPVMAVVLFSGFPVALILAGVGLLFCGLGWLTGD